MSEESKRTGMQRLVLPGVLVAASIAYAFAIHQGFGPRPEVPDSALRWWSPRGFATLALLGTSWDWLIEQRGKGMAFLVAPSLLLLAVVFASTRSALARVTALVATFATVLFLYYALGVGVTQVAWKFFHWRASATMLAVAAVIGCTIGSPWLAASWLRLGWPARLAWILPVVALVLVVERNVTGTNDALPFAISPWPAVQVFGFEAIGTTVASQLAGVALALFGVHAWRANGLRFSGAVLILAGIATPALAWRAFSWLELLPFRVTQQRMLGAAIFCSILIAVAASSVRFDPKRLRTRAVHAAAAAALVGVPLFIGTSWARWDYTRTRDYAARRIIDALDAYYLRESTYPDDLSMLVKAGFLDTVPKPEIGFAIDAGGETDFTYQAFGTSYLLEFSAPRWVQCAYNPPYDDEEDDEEDAADGATQGGVEEELGAGSWSCPSKPPELW